jgi:hypothetical protein
MKQELTNRKAAPTLYRIRNPQKPRPRSVYRIGTPQKHRFLPPFGDVGSEWKTSRNKQTVHNMTNIYQIKQIKPNKADTVMKILSRNDTSNTHSPSFLD